MLQKSLAKVIGENIARQRRKIGLTQRQLAERLDIGQDALSRMEKGSISPKIARLRDFSAALECSVASFFHEQDENVKQRTETIAELIQPMSAQEQDAVVRIVRELAGMARMEKE
jgi:transcriptional regulator with XRE-family HTH domain